MPGAETQRGKYEVIYTHVLNKRGKGMKSPMDALSVEGSLPFRIRRHDKNASFSQQVVVTDVRLEPSTAFAGVLYAAPVRLWIVRWIGLNIVMRLWPLSERGVT